MTNNIWHNGPGCRKTGALLKGEDKKGRQPPLNDGYGTWCACRNLLELLAVLCSHSCDTYCRLRTCCAWTYTWVMSTGFQGAGQDLTNLQQKAPNTSPSIQPWARASFPSHARALELGAHFKACLSHLIPIPVSYLGLFTSFQRPWSSHGFHMRV